MEIWFGLRGKGKHWVPFVSGAHSTVTVLATTECVLICRNDRSSAIFCGISKPSEIKMIKLNTGITNHISQLLCNLNSVYLENWVYNLSLEFRSLPKNTASGGYSPVTVILQEKKIPVSPVTSGLFEESWGISACSQAGSGSLDALSGYLPNLRTASALGRRCCFSFSCSLPDAPLRGPLIDSNKIQSPKRHKHFYKTWVPRKD